MWIDICGVICAIKGQRCLLNTEDCNRNRLHVCFALHINFASDQVL